MRFHKGGGRIVAWARRSLRGQVIGTGIRHELRWHHRCTSASAVVNIAVRVVSSTFSARLITSLRRALRVSPTAFAAVDIVVVLGLTEVDDGRAARARNPHQDLDDIHARTRRPRSWKLTRLAAFGHLPPVCVHARHEGSGQRTLGLHLSRPRRSPTRRRHPAPLLGRELDASIAPILQGR